MRYEPNLRPYRTIPPVTMRGGNLCGIAFAPASGGWASSWVVYPSAKSTWVYPQVNALASIGGTLIRSIGTVEPVTTGTITRATYLSYWGDFLQYCHSKGLWVHVCASSYPSFNGCTFPNGTGGVGVFPEAVTEIAALAKFVQHFPNVWLFEITNEMQGWSNGTQTNTGGTLINACTTTQGQDFINRSIAAVRAVAPDLPVGSSCLILGDSQVTSSDTAAIVAASDYIDFHLYNTYGTTTASNVSAVMSAQPNKKGVCGEYGINTGFVSDANFASILTNRRSLSERSGWYGGSWWDIAGQPQALFGASSDFGMFDTTPSGSTYTVGAARPLTVAAFQAAAGTRLPVRFQKRRKLYR